jgi:hypothetical protein
MVECVQGSRKVTRPDLNGPPPHRVLPPSQIIADPLPFRIAYPSLAWTLLVVDIIDLMRHYLYVNYLYVQALCIAAMQWSRGIKPFIINRPMD